MVTLLTLPNELLTQICLHLLPRDAKLLASTCRALQSKLTIENNYLWFNFLATFPFLRHRRYSSHVYPLGIPWPVCAATGRFDRRVNYFAKAVSILCAQTPGCFDCFNVNKGSLREVHVGGIFYRTYCIACYELSFERISNFSITWPEIEIPESLIGRQTNTSFTTIHHNDAIFLIKEQIPRHIRSSKGRFVSVWELKLKIRKSSDEDPQDPLWSEIDPRLLDSSGMEDLIVDVASIYKTDEVFRKFLSLGDDEDLRDHLKASALDFLSSISKNLIKMMGAQRIGARSPGIGLWKLRKTLLEAEDQQHTHQTDIVEHAFKMEVYRAEMCKNYLLEIIRIDPRPKLLHNWMTHYITNRAGFEINGDCNQYRPFTCSFCREEKVEEKTETEAADGDQNGNSLDSRELRPFLALSELAFHILTRHGERFDERWVTGGGIIEPLDKGRWKPFWKTVKSLDD
ncbi:hypothetical protein TWF481_011690 [Arthrobotrys musiformis]|uniref:F-box domain-containing protein n=1 Tax=Arthrobotrys musiformis TaxID=47236 RepID=A0AAV9W525_9PEZI